MQKNNFLLDENNSRVYIFEHIKGNNFTQVAVLGPYDGNSNVRYIKVADANLDGKQEIIVTDAYKKNHFIRIYAVTKDNTWKEVWKDNITKDTKWWHYPNGVEVGDLDNDNKPELYVGVSLCDFDKKKCHGWLYVYEITENNQYKKIWKSDDREYYVRDVRILKEKDTGKIMIAGQVTGSWALFEPSGQDSYKFSGMKKAVDLKELFEEL